MAHSASMTPQFAKPHPFPKLDPTHYLFTSEAVAIGHPDKVADQISDAIVDACIAQDPESRVACETLVAAGLIVLAGEITTTAKVDYPAIARETIKDIGYTSGTLGFDYRSVGVISTLSKQSPDIAQGVNEGEGLYKEQGAGDQGIVFGFACDETPELMPLTAQLSQELVKTLRDVRTAGELPYLCPDAKSQVTVEYDANCQPVHIHTVVLSTQHTDQVEYDTLYNDMKALIIRTAPDGLIDDTTCFFINPTGRFLLGGPKADCGLTGRKPIVDTYGGVGRHGGGAFSGKDPSKIDRSAAYASRYAAKNIVAAKLAKRCEVQLSYAIGVAHPISIKVETFGTATVPEQVLAAAIADVFDLSAKGAIEMLNLKRPIFRKTAFGGHFGRHDKDFTWENTDRTEQLLKSVKQHTT